MSEEQQKHPMDEKSGNTVRDKLLHFTHLIKYYLKKHAGFLWKIARHPIYAALGGILALLILVPLFTYVLFAFDITSKENIISKKDSGVLLLDRNGTPFFTFYEAKNNKTIPLAGIPKYAQESVIAVEDKDFYNHPGFSPRGIARAIVSDVKNEQLSQGGSTISQQLVKNTLLTQDKNFLRKYQEIVLALELERRFSKNDILEMYLNTVYFGEGAFGIEDAARAYFGKSAKNLTLAEAALLAGILPAPSAYSPISGNRDLAFARQKIVLQNMVEQKYITPLAKQLALDQQIIFHPTRQEINDKAPHFALMVKDELIKKYGEQKVARSGYKIRTTIDLRLQEYAESAVKYQVARLSINKVTNGAAVVMDPKTGELLSVVGSHDWYDTDNGKINMVTHARQPGSSFKPIIYAKAFEQHLVTPATILDDKPITFPGNYKPKNYDGKFRGKILARFALANSLNIPSVEVMEKVGVPGGLEIAKRLGITTLKDPVDYGLSLVLGSGEVPLLEMTRAYAVFANNGTKVNPTTIIEITDKKGNIIYTNTPESSTVLSPGVAFQIASILSDNAARQPVFGNALTITRPAAVKTGTSENYRDALTLGFTPQIAVGVWVGNNDNKPMDSIAGSLGAAPIWRLLMEKYLQGKPVEKFTPPLGIVRVNVCRENGYRAEVATASAYPEFFLHGTTPIQLCTKPGEFPDSISPTPINSGPTRKPTVTPEQAEEFQFEEITNTPEPTVQAEQTSTPEPTSDNTIPTPPGITISVP